MALLVAGLLIFLGIHTTGILASDWRQGMIAKLGLQKWKLLYTVLAVAGLALIIVGYGAARMDPTWLWMPPVWTRHLAMPLTLIAFILLAATYVPANSIKAKFGHPMLAAVKVWAIAHLLANGSLADLLLFGGFLIWAIVGFAVLRRRDRSNAVVYPKASLKGNITTGVAGVLAWAVFAMVLHTMLIGVSPLP